MSAKNRLRHRSATLRWVGGALAFLTIGRLAVAEELVAHRFVSDTPSAQIEEILYLSAGVELVEAGLSSSRDVAKNAADYVLHTDYRIDGEMLHVEYRLERTHLLETGVEARELSMSVSLDSDLDREVAGGIGRLLAAAQVERSPNQEARIVGYSQAVPEESEAPEEEEVLAEPDSPVEHIVQDDQNPQEHVDAGRDQRDRARFAVSGGPVFPVGEGSDVFRIGLAGGLQVGIGGTGGAAPITWGGDIAVYRLFPDEEVSGGTLDTATVGPAVGVQFGVPGAARVSGRLSAGLAVVSVAGAGSRLTKMAPYATIRLATDVAVGPRASLGFGVHSCAVYEASLPIVGVVPEVRIVLER